MTTTMVDADGVLSNQELAEAIFEESRWRTGSWFERWLINRRRRREGKTPFTDATPA